MASGGATATVEWHQRPQNPKNPIVFFDVTIGTIPAGRIKMELFADLAPKTAENFRKHVLNLWELLLKFYSLVIPYSFYAGGAILVGLVLDKRLYARSATDVEQEIECISGPGLKLVRYTLHSKFYASMLLEGYGAVSSRQFCTGEYRKAGLPVGYKGCQFHRVIKDFMIQAGDFVKGDGSGCVSIYGSKFEDESFVAKHTGPGLLSMANSGPSTNGCQFFVTCSKCDWLDNKHVVFGRVVGDGLLVVRKIENVATGPNNRPKLACVIAECGEM
ncbi:hypothetical protein GIB67_030515 [Kingdonia uniflora]|uniref:peptidylprolyl isomerase n=1 Tax=Kingdonia uniflora TaxID=39325 RepID=A0A7J7LD42_9MAGN|nr:hypothetical protein GIB67_030515 [Kingdonia uniflora]